MTTAAAPLLSAHTLVVDQTTKLFEMKNEYRIFDEQSQLLGSVEQVGQGILTFLASWNSFLWPLVAIRSPELMTLPLGLATLQGQYTFDYGKLMAGALLGSVPVAIVYSFFVEYYVSGMTGSVKE